MIDQQWFVYQNNQQLGPFHSAQITQMLDSKMIAQEAYLFKAGWKDWRPIEECFADLGLPKGETKVPSHERRATAPRATIQGRVIVHNNGQLIIGSGVNISSTGIFVETQEQIFTVGETLKLSVRVDGFVKAFNVIARVIRYNSDPKFPVGFGLSFESLDRGIGEEIERMVSARRAMVDSSKVG